MYWSRQYLSIGTAATPALTSSLDQSIGIDETNTFQSDQYMPLFDFKLLIAEHLCKAGKVKKRGRPAMTPTSSPCTSREGTPTTSKRRKRQENPLNSVREDHIGHFPTWKKQRQLCKNDCSFRSYTFCEKCNVFFMLQRQEKLFYQLSHEVMYTCKLNSSIINELKKCIFIFKTRVINLYS